MCTVTMGTDSKIPHLVPHALKKQQQLMEAAKKTNQWKLNSTEIAQLTKIDFCL